MNFWVIQGLGFIAFLIGITTYQFNNRRTILSLLTVYNSLFGIQYLLLGSLNSMLLCMIGAGRNIVFYYDNKFGRKARYFILSFFIAVTLVLTWLNWNGILSFLGCIGTILSTLSLWQKNERNIRILSLLSGFFWLAHDILIGSYAAVIDGILLTVSIIIAMYRFDIKKTDIDNAINENDKAFGE